MTATPTTSRLVIWLDARAWAVGLLAMVMVCLAYLPAMKGEFLWDDFSLVTENGMIRSPLLMGESFRHTLTMNGASRYYRPVQNVSYAVCYWAGGLNPMVYHFTNCLLHGAAAFLLWRLLRALLVGRPGVALAVAGIWAVHPCHNAAVAYISGRADSLAAVFSLGAWLCYRRGAGHKAWFVAAAGLLFLGLCSKEIAMVWAATFLIYEAGFSQQKVRSHLLGALVVIVVNIGIVAWLRTLPEELVAVAAQEAPSGQGRVGLAVRAIGDYLGLIVWPSSLYMERMISNRGPFLWLLGAAALILLSLAVCVPGTTRTMRRFGAVWFVAGFLPISNLYRLRYEAAEHWIYMPLAGALLAICMAITALPKRWQAAFPALLCVVMLALGTRTAFRAHEWSNAVRLFSRTIEEGGGTFRVYINLAAVLMAAGDVARSEELYRKLDSQVPDEPVVKRGLARILKMRGDIEGAKAMLGVAAETPPEGAAPRVPDVKPFDDAIAAEPHQWRPHHEKAKFLHGMGKSAEALALVQAWVNAHWWHREGRMVLGDMRRQRGETAAAIAEFEMAGRLDVHDAEAFCEIAKTQLGEGNGKGAREALEVALERDANGAAVKATLTLLKESIGASNKASQPRL